jgi:hypothetical protein
MVSQSEPTQGLMIEFAPGTIGIGRPWGFADPEVPASERCTGSFDALCRSLDGSLRRARDTGCGQPPVFAFIPRKRFEGAVLSGTKSAEHLEENWRAFGEAAATTENPLTE